MLAQCFEIEWEEGKIEWRFITSLFELQNPFRSLSPFRFPFLMSAIP